MVFSVLQTTRYEYLGGRDMNSCSDCMLYKKGDCFGQSKICNDFKYSPSMSSEEKENWPIIMGSSKYAIQEHHRQNEEKIQNIMESSKCVNQVNNTKNVERLRKQKENIISNKNLQLKQVHNLSVKEFNGYYVNVNEALKVYFGYDSFREGQESIINTIMAGQDALAIMPTGAGKSICYQVPALMLHGITIIISPLISLMQDQVKALNEVGIHAAFINSSLSFFINAKNSSVKFS